MYWVREKKMDWTSHVGFGKPSPSALNRICGESCCMDCSWHSQASPPPSKHWHWYSFIMLHSILSFSMRSFDKTRSSHQLLRVIFYPLLRDCTLYILEASSMANLNGQTRKELNKIQSYFSHRKIKTLFCISGMNKWDFNKHVCWRLLIPPRIYFILQLCFCLFCPLLSP